MLGIGASLLLAGLGLVTARPFLILLGAGDEILPLALAYLWVALVGVFTLVLSFIINSVLRGAGEARWSMRVLILSTTTTVLLEPLLIFGLGPFPSLGVAGSAWAFLLGYGAGLIMQILLLVQGRVRIGLHWRHLRPELPLMKRIMAVALPSTL